MPIADDDIKPRLGDIRCPAIVFHGTVVPGAAHAANLTHPEVINPPLVEFLRAHA